MPAFIRVTWIDVDDEEKRNLENQYKKTLGLAINLKEFRNGAHIQEKGTIDLKMNGQFDSHLYEGRQAEMVLNDSNKVALGTTSIEITRLASAAKASQGCSTVIKLPFQATIKGVTHQYFIKLYIKLYNEVAPDRNDSKSEMPLSGGIKRRNAKRDHNVIYEQLGHEFQRHYFRQPTYCGFCRDFLWGIGKKQGFLCRHCKYAVHTECVERVITRCQQNRASLTSISTTSLSVNIPHKFKRTTFRRPTFCTHCGQFIFGFIKQGVKCLDCPITCHHKCMAQVANTCGTDMAKLADAMANLPSGKNIVPKPTKVEQDDGMAIYAFDPNATVPVSGNGDSGDELEDIYAFPSEYVMPPTAKPVAPIRKTTIMKREKIDEIMSTKSFIFQTVLGRGSFGKVLLTRITDCEMTVAVKAMKKHTVQQNGDILATAVEKNMLELAWEHPYLAHLIATVQDDGYLYFVMEYLSGGDLMHWIQKKRIFKRDVATFYAAEIYSGLNFLHHRKIVYRDLKLDNVLLDAEGHCRIADFGMCRENVSDMNKCATFCGTPEYLAPEIIKRELYTFSVDWWSYGVLVYEMITGMSPFSGDNEDILYKSILHDKVQYTSKMDRESKSFCEKLFERDPKRRLGVASPVKNHPFFKSIDFEKLEQKQVPPPFVPAVKDENDTTNFDAEFVSQKPRLTVVDRNQLSEIDQSVFKNFNTVNPRAHEILKVRV